MSSTNIVTKMSSDSPIDIQFAVNNLGGQEAIFYSMLEKLEDFALTNTMKEMIIPFETMNYQKMKELAHSLKGSSSYVGASRIHYTCFFIQDNFLNKKFEKMLDYYPGLVEAAIEFKIHSRKAIA